MVYGKIEKKIFTGTIGLSLIEYQVNLLVNG
jgi:hypothetical protein